MARAQARAGNTAAAVAALDKAISLNSAAKRWAQTHPDLKDLRDDPGYRGRAESKPKSRPKPKPYRT